MKTTGRGVAMVALLVLVPALFVVNVWQSYRYQRLQREIVAVHDRHVDALEDNKRLIVGVATLRSPDRIRQLGAQELDLDPLNADRILRLEIQRTAGDR